MPPQHAVLGPKVPRTLWRLFGAVTLVLVIAAANVANLFLVRMEARRRESAIRAALGADRTKLAAHYFAERLPLCMAGAVAGLPRAAAGLRALLAIAPTDIPRLAALTLPWRSVGAALVVAAPLGVVLGLVPTLRRALDLGALREGMRGLSPSPGQRLVRRSLVVGQIALSPMLLVGAGLMVRSFDRLRGRAGVRRDEHAGLRALAAVHGVQVARGGHRVSPAAAAAPARGSGRHLRGRSDLDSAGGMRHGGSVVFREGGPYAMGEQTPILVLLGLAVAVVLSAVGIYGGMSFVVTLHRCEIGIRIALGATVTQVVRLVLVQSVWLAMLGVCIGLGGALAAAGTLRAVLFEVSPTDRVVLGVVTVALPGLTMVASLLPSGRGARADPTETLRTA
jgi:ABC-type antimicrobial peptide transport system permease subunit